jgi:hypothetical protein
VFLNWLVLLSQGVIYLRQDIDSNRPHPATLFDFLRLDRPQADDFCAHIR